MVRGGSESADGVSAFSVDGSIEVIVRASGYIQSAYYAKNDVSFQLDQVSTSMSIELIRPFLPFDH
jgi:hypothetical protein